MSNCHSWPQDVSSNVKLPFLTTRCYCHSVWPVDVIWHWGTGVGGPSVKALDFICSNVWHIVVFKACILNSEGGPSAKEGLSAKCCVLVFKVSMLYLWVIHLPVDKLGWGGGPSVYQVLCTGIQGIYAVFMWRVGISGIQGMYSQFRGGSISQNRIMDTKW